MTQSDRFDKLTNEQINTAILNIESRIKEWKQILKDQETKRFNDAQDYAENKVHEQAADLLKMIENGSYAV
jgi:hypothetical protein